ncbi:MAG: DUF1552 domain-containing protein [Myxococcota bacterium]
MKYLTRRELIRTASLGGASVFLSSLVSSRAFAAGEGQMRTVFIMSHNGVMPSGVPRIVSALAAHQPTVVRGLNYRWDGGHVFGSPSFLTNSPCWPEQNQNNSSIRASHASLDWRLAQEATANGYGGGSTLITAATGANAWGGGEFITYEDALVPRASETRPERLFTQVFGNYTPPSDNMPPNDGSSREEALRRVAAMRAALAFSMQEYTTVRGLVGASERDRLDGAAERIQSLGDQEIARLENSIDPDSGGVVPEIRECAVGEAPIGVPREELFRRQSDIIAEALHCGETYVATLRFYHGRVDNGDHHSWHHGEGSSDPAAEHDDYMAWQAGQVAQFLDNLASRPMGSGSLLDCTQVVWGNEIGVGGFQNHGGNDVPFFMFGGGRQGGRNISGSGSHSQLLVSIAGAAGVELDGWGNMDGCEPGPLEQL